MTLAHSKIHNDYDHDEHLAPVIQWIRVFNLPLSIELDTSKISIPQHPEPI